MGLASRARIIFCALFVLVVLVGLRAWGSVKYDVNDYIDKVVYGTDGTYLYALHGNNTILRLDSDGEISQTGKDFSTIDADFVIHTIIPTTTTNLVFVVVERTTDDKYYLFKSIDGGLNFGDNSPNYDDNDYVLILGDTDGTEANQIANAKVLYDRGFCEAEISGTTTYLLGEYVTGGVNNPVRLMKSTNAGDTWTEVCSWNDGDSEFSYQIDHIHVVRQNPYDGNIYIGTGDDGDECQFLIWDGSSSLSDSNIKVKGSQRHRTVDFLFTEDYIYTFSDTSTTNTTETGIWQWSHDFSSGTRVNNDVGSYTGHKGWFGLKESNGDLTFITQPDDTATDRQSKIFSSTDGGATWQIVAVVGLKDYQPTQYGAIPVGYFRLNNKIYYGTPNGAGKNKADCIVFCNTSGNFDEEFPTILHPVYWVATDGSNTTTGGRGWYPDLPWATLEYAQEGNHITKGARVIVEPGSYTQYATACDWDGNAHPGTGISVFEGAGRDETIITDISTTAYSIRHELEEGYALYKGMTIKRNINEDGYHLLYVGDTASEDVVIYSRDMTWGDDSVYGGTIVMCYNTFDAYRTEFLSGTTSTAVIFPQAGSSDVTLKNCLSVGGPYVYYTSLAGATLTAYNCTFYGYANGAIRYKTNADQPPIVKNCIFGESSVYAISDDDNDVAETDIDYNCYAKTTGALINVTDGGNSITQDPLFVNVPNKNFRLRPSSPCIDAGTPISSVTQDIEGHRRPIGLTWDIGAYEYLITKGWKMAPFENNPWSTSPWGMSPWSH